MESYQIEACQYYWYFYHNILIETDIFKVYNVIYDNVKLISSRKDFNMKTQYEKEIINENNNGSHSEENTNMLVAAFMFFIFPIIVTFLGVLVAGYIGGLMEVSIGVSQIIGGIVAFALSTVIIKLFDKSITANKNSKKIDWDHM